MAIVITGDIIGSSKLVESARQQTLNELIRGIFGTLKQLWPGAEDLRTEAVQGDAFQVFVRHDADGLRAAFVIKSFCLAQPKLSASYRIDCRLSIGLGATTLLHPDTLAASGGEAFEYSGRGLKSIVPEGPQIIFKAPGDGFTEAIMMGLALADALIRHWTAAQSQAVLLRLIYTQKNDEWLGSQIGISRSAYWQRMRQINWPSFEALLLYYSSNATLQ